MTVTLTGGNNVSSILYYSSASSVGYQAAVALDGILKADFPLDYMQMDSTAGGTTGTDTSSAGLPVLDISTAMTTINAANYSAIVDEATGPITLNITSTVAGGTSVLAGSGGGTFLLADNSNATIVAGDGNYWVGHENNTGNLDVTLGNGNDTINNMMGNSTITTGTGSNIINLYQGVSGITLNGTGYDTVNAGVGSESVSVASGADHVLISENLSQLSFTNGSASSTIRGGGGATTINAGGTGSVLYTAESYDFFIGSGSLSSLTDSVTDFSAGADTLMAGAGTTTVNVADSGASDTLVSGTGSSTLIGSLTQADTFEVGGLASGSHSITINNWTSADTFEVQGFAGQMPPAAVQSGADSTITLTDGTVVTFTDTTASSITNIVSV